MKLSLHRLKKTLKYNRERTKCGQKQVAKAVGISVNTLSKLENGKIKDPKLTVILKLAGFYDYSYQEFIDSIYF